MTDQPSEARTFVGADAAAMALLAARLHGGRRLRAAGLLALPLAAGFATALAG